MANPIEELRNFMAQSRMDFSNWTPIRVATHLIEAGRRSMCGEPPYEFPGGIFFPYDQLLGQEHKIENLPFEYADADASLKLVYLMKGRAEFKKMQLERTTWLAVEAPKVFMNLYNVEIAFEIKQREKGENSAGKTRTSARAQSSGHGVASRHEQSVPIESNVGQRDSMPIAQTSAGANQDALGAVSSTSIVADTNGAGAAVFVDMNAGASSNAIDMGFGPENMLGNIRDIVDSLGSAWSLEMPPNVAAISAALSQEGQPTPAAEVNIEDRPIRRPVRGPRNFAFRKRPERRDVRQAPQEIALYDIDELARNMTLDDQNPVQIQIDEEMPNAQIDSNLNDAPFMFDMVPADAVQADAPIVGAVQLEDENVVGAQAAQANVQMDAIAQATDGQLDNQANIDALVCEQFPGPTSSVRRGLVKQPNLLKKAIGRLGKNAQPKKRQLRTHAGPYPQNADLPLAELQLPPEEDDVPNLRLQDASYLTEYFERIVDLICVHGEVSMDEYMDKEWEPIQCEYALKALTTFATDDIIRIIVEDGSMTSFKIADEAENSE